MPKVTIAARDQHGLTTCEHCQQKIANVRDTKPNRFDNRWPVLCEVCFPESPYFIAPKRRLSKFFRASDAKTQAIKRRAERDGIEIELVDADIAAIICQDCHYCGASGSVERPVGIDRKDNDAGYVHGNCLPCCSMCNFMKSTYGYLGFIRKCNEIAVKHPRRFSGK